MLPEIALLADHCLPGLLDYVVPVLADRLIDYQPRIQALVAEQLRLVDLSALDPHLAQELSLVAFKVLQPEEEPTDDAHRDPLHAFLGDVLEKSIPVAPWTPLDYQQLLGIYDDYAASPVQSQRVMAQKLLNGISRIAVDLHTFNNQILARLINALPDVEPLVTSSTLQSLSSLLETNPNSTMYHRLWREIINIWDEDIQVSIAGKAEVIQVASKIVSIRNRESIACTKTIESAYISFYRSICRFSTELCTKDLLFIPHEQCNIVYVIACEFGPLTLYSQKTLDAKTQRAGIDAFTALATCNEASIRLKSVYNIPAVARVLGPKYRSTMLKVLQLLATDEESEIRKLVAKGFHETIKPLANRRNANHIFAIYNLLVKDGNDGVQLASMQNFSTVVETLHKCRQDIRFDELIDLSVIRVITESDWRSGEAGLRQISLAADLFSTNWKQNSLCVLLARVFQDGMPPTRRVAGEVLVTMLRSLPTAENRKLCVQRFCDTVQTGRFAMRISLVETLFYAIDQFSRAAFCELFSDTVFDLASDPVRDIRMRVATGLHRLAPSCQEVPRFTRVIEALTSDEGQNVKAAMEGFIERASFEVRKAKEDEEEDEKLLKCETVSEFETASNATSSTGIPSQIVKLFSKRVSARKGILKARGSFKKGRGRNGETEVFAEYGPGVEFVSSDDDNSGEAEMGAAEGHEANGELEENENSERFMAMADFFSDEPKSDIVTSLVTPERTRRFSGDIHKPIQEAESPSLMSSLRHLRVGNPSSLRKSKSGS